MNWFTNKILQAESTIKNAITNAATSLKSGDDFVENYGVSQELSEFVQNICSHPKTFTDFPLGADKEGKATHLHYLI